MQTFHLIVQKNKLILFEKSGDNFERIHVEGNPELAYDLNCVKEDVDKLLSFLKNEYNLDSVEEIDFVMIDNENKIISDILRKVLENHIKEIVNIEQLILEISQKLSTDPKLHILDYGINYDGINYLYQNGSVNKTDFSLLGYTLSADNLMKFMA